MKVQMEADVRAVPTPIRSEHASCVADPDADTIPGDPSAGQPSQPSSVDGSPKAPSAVVDKAPVVAQDEVEQPPAPVDTQPPGSPKTLVETVSWLLLSLWVSWENNPF